MSSTINSGLRYQVIDKRLKDPNCINHWKDLAHACALYSEEILGSYMMPSKRTIAYDISRMKSGVLGYEAPIQYDYKAGYFYSNRKFSIYNVPLTSTMIEELKDAIFLLKQLTQNEKLLSLRTTLSILEERLNLQIDQNKKPSIYLEHSLNEPGQQWLDVIYNHIKSKTAIAIAYQPFDKSAIHHILSPYFIKEYSNRWYLIGYEHNMTKCINLALDRIVKISPTLKEYDESHIFDHDAYYKNVYGITVFDDAVIEQISFRAIPLLSKYLITKPIHPSQQKVSEHEDGTLFTLDVVYNYEILHKLLSYGGDLEILSPEFIRNEFASIIRKMLSCYPITV